MLCWETLILIWVISDVYKYLLFSSSNIELAFILDSYIVCFHPEQQAHITIYISKLIVFSGKNLP